jgi:ParB-like chromosome segregation protein Spo0J
MIHKDIQKLSVDIDSVTTHPRNVRQGDVGAISESLQHNGQYRPIVVQKSTKHILAGNHTWLAAKSLGWKKIAVTFVDVDDESALRILLVDNKSNDIANYDDIALAELLQELVNTEQGLIGTNYDGNDIDNLLKDIHKQNDETIDKELTGDAIDLGEKFEVVIECENEYQQTMLLEKLSGEGYKVRAIVV